MPVGIDDDGRERLLFIEGDVPLPPYPAWAQLDSALASIAILMRRFHDASRSFDSTGSTWSDEMVDPAGGPIVCHNDVCLENVVFNEGIAVGLLDFDFAAPGRGVYDLAQMARMCVPIDDDVNAARLGWQPADRPARLRLVADAYGLDQTSRHEFLAILSHELAAGSRPAIPTSSTCGTRWAARIASTGDAAGGLSTKIGSRTRSSDASPRIHRRGPRPLLGSVRVRRLLAIRGGPQIAQSTERDSHAAGMFRRTNARISDAACGMLLPGPNTAATPASWRNS